MLIEPQIAGLACHRATPQDIKNVLGHQAYILESIKALGNLKSYRMHLTWDDGETDGEFIFGMVTNTTSVGGFRGLAPKDHRIHPQKPCGDT